MNKSDFPLLTHYKKLLYLDSAATSQKPESVIAAEQNYYEELNANVHRGIYKLSEKATTAYESSREVMAAFLGADPDEIIFTPGATASLNFVALGLLHKLVKKGSKNTVLTSVMEHHVNMLPFQQHGNRLGMTLEYVGLAQDFRLDMKELEKKLDTGSVRVLAITHMSNVLGTITPLAEIIKLVRSISPETIVVADGAQYAPHYPVNLHELDVDFYAVAGHKMLGPTGIGILYGKKELLNKMDPALTGGGMIGKVERMQSSWAEGPAKHEAGTPNIAGAVGLAEAARYLQTVGFKKLVAHEEELSGYMLAKLQGISGLTIFGPQENKMRGGVFSFALAGIHPHDVAQLLDEENIAVRAGHHCNQILMREVLNVPATTRASLYLYNDYADVDRFVEGILKVQEKFKR